ncbi:hypothetical protein [Rubritalea tangerina]
MFRTNSSAFSNFLLHRLISFKASPPSPLYQRSMSHPVIPPGHKLYA